MKNRFLFALTFLMLLTFSCSQKKKDGEVQLEVKEKKIAADWILGQWFHETEEGVLLEDWEKLNDSIYLGKSYLMAEGDTLFSETLTINLKGDSLVYSSQNLQTIHLKTKDFNGIHNNYDYFEVRNDLQAFPKTIKYQALNDTLLMIEIGGIIDGEQETQPYQMTKRAKK